MITPFNRSTLFLLHEVCRRILKVGTMLPKRVPILSKSSGFFYLGFNYSDYHWFFFCYLLWRLYLKRDRYLPSRLDQIEAKKEYLESTSWVHQNSDPCEKVNHGSLKSFSGINSYLNCRGMGLPPLDSRKVHMHISDANQ